jgi:hypothetical protein
MESTPKKEIPVKKTTTLNKWKTWIRKLGYPVKPRAERRIPSGFAARRRNNSASKPATIRDISSTGLHLLTEERWPLGELIPLTVEVERFLENRSEPQFAVQARVVRHVEDGIGLSFVLPAGLDPNLWEVLLRNAVVLTDPKDILYTLRMLRTVLFLCQLCHAEAHQAILLLGGELDQPRTENAMEIAHSAEKLLASEPDAERMRAHPHLVASILKNGSWADDLTRQLWAGLLATSCTAEGTDESNSVFVDLLVNVTHTQSRIFVAACIKALELMSGTEYPPSTRIILTPEQMIRLTGMYDASRIATDIAYLFNSGIIEKNFDFSSYLPLESFDITPARLGLELFERCKGHCIKPNLPMDLSAGAQPLPQDFAQVAFWDREAAEQSYAKAQADLGVMYELGSGVPQDYDEAVSWYRKAAEQGYSQAQFNLGMAYNKGQGVQQDHTQAAMWYRKAAEQGYADAQNMLGHSYEIGQGVPQDFAKAALWYRKAADQGDGLAQWSLGRVYEIGHGLPQNYAEAYFWLNLAAAVKIEGVEREDVAKKRDAAASRLTAADLSRIQERTREWFAAHPLSSK